MILIDNFYTIKSQNISDEKAEFFVKLNAEHFIFQAHFPDNPITPGVCLIQIATELFNLLKKTTFRINTLKNAKFLETVNPLVFPEVDFILDFSQVEIGWLLKVLIKKDETIFAKMSMVLV
jgi:3-hydroxyacyl-[acyl-carrier-protein] dehydratase